ncbi:MAG: circularly permuted type 2 ATP-grasp protein [Magnetococcales bacterium]|nr:circularly permuted type 2 ATP-grasp protein [Magnetococcales bacterium]
MSINWAKYPRGEFYDELVDNRGKPRPYAQLMCDYLTGLDRKELKRRQAASELAVVNLGITFTIYSEAGNIDRAWPFDIIPRIIDLAEWRRTEEGLIQRLTALNLFIDDLYNEQKIIKDGVFPQEVLDKSKNFLKQCVGIRPKHGVWAHVCGSDLLRDRDGTLYVLEDNLRVPSGVSYMLENRLITKRVFPELLRSLAPLSVDDYPANLFETLASLSPRPDDTPQVVVLTPGIYNSAYFEHAYLAQQMGVELVEGRDLIVDEDDCLYMQTITGLKRVDVVYRRVDDLFIDPQAFKPESTLGVAGLMRAWRKGNVALANAPGSGVADDKVVYAFVPDIIRYYLDQEPILPNVHTYKCMNDSDRAYVLEHLDELVVKPANESGGYGMLVGPHSTKIEQEQFRILIQENPRNYIAQPTLTMSTVPTVFGTQVDPRHVDLRPFILQGEKHHVTAGGLTRVALRKGSLVVNSSQGGGSKDTWIVDQGGKSSC